MWPLHATLNGRPLPSPICNQLCVCSKLIQNIALITFISELPLSLPRLNDVLQSLFPRVWSKVGVTKMSCWCRIINGPYHSDSWFHRSRLRIFFENPKGCMMSCQKHLNGYHGMWLIIFWSKTDSFRVYQKRIWIHVIWIWMHIICILCVVLQWYTYLFSWCVDMIQYAIEVIFIKGLATLEALFRCLPPNKHCLTIHIWNTEPDFLSKT